jgi:hypothetical protein
MTTIIKFLRPLGLAAATVAAGSFILQSAPASAVELVTNGNFGATTANDTGWSRTGTTSIVPVSAFTNGADPLTIALTSGFGNVAVVGSVPATVPAVGSFAPISSGTWSYNLVTNPGSLYNLSYNFANYSKLVTRPSQASQSFQVTRNGVLIAGTSLSGTSLDTSIVSTLTSFTGSGNDVLSFVFNGVTASAIDNVSVQGPAPLPGTPAPEPFTIIGTLIGGSAAIRMRRKLNLGK